MKNLTIPISIFVFTSCIPYKVAPTFKNEDFKVMKANKLQDNLPMETSFIFKDYKSANEFYQYINKKFNLEDINVGVNTPFELNNEIFYLSFSEVESIYVDECSDQEALVINSEQGLNKNSKRFEHKYIKRSSYWYIVITVYDEDIKNCLLDKHPKKSIVLNYLKDLRREYLTTFNHDALLFTSRS
ncbi:hypothetical protein [Winogradskyella sp.]|uniref:hypothetical protein n=1 Tax=Winogradskyella sp. TaxID=1883156 RepID=UPI0026188F76|nr:hypothetical protein [Winogradskyella sp.]